MKINLLLNVIQRYLYHSTYQTENPITQNILEKMRDVELDELWMLTQT